VYPPVETTFYTPASDGSVRGPALTDRADLPVEGVLVVSALVPYKRVDLAIAAARRAQMPLTIVGDGPERAQLQSLAGSNVRFRGWCTNDEIRDLYRSSIATILPGEEDFGIVPLEAQACGRPVVALGRGGACETVIDGVTGVLVEPGEEALADGLRRAAATGWEPRRIREHAERFGRDRFVTKIEQAIDETMAAPAGERW